MIATAMYIFGAIQGAWSLNAIPVGIFMGFDLALAGMLSPTIERR